MYKIGHRTIKTAIGTALAIYIAQLLQLENATAAGILTILCIQVTKRRSVRSSWERLIACFLGMAVSSILFELIGYTPLTIGIILLVFIPFLVMIKAAADGVVTSAVIILHIYVNKDISVEFLINEVIIIIIGIGVALIVNSYMPNVERKILHYREQIESNFSIIMKEMVKYLRMNDTSWSGGEITETVVILEEAKSLAKLDRDNRFDDDSHYYSYIEMREKQFEIIERMLPLVTSIDYEVEQGEMVASLLEDVSNAIHSYNNPTVFLIRLEELRNSFKEMPLPQTREEFEVRAALLQFVKEMELFLIIKINSLLED